MIADRFFPSGKTYSACDEKKDDLSLKDHIFVCDNCGLVIDRDLNASINLNHYGVDTLQPALKRTQKLSKTVASVTASAMTV